MRYRLVLLPFVLWLMSINFDPCTPEQLDDALAAYADQDKTTKGNFSQLVSSVKSCLPMLWVFAVALGRELRILGLVQLGRGLLVQFDG